MPIVLRALGQQLSRVDVRATRESRQLEEARRRTMFWGGTHLGRAEIERLNPQWVTDLLVAGWNIRVKRDAGGGVVPLGRFDCVLSILLNGVPVRSISIDDLVAVDNVEAIEAQISVAVTPAALMLMSAAYHCGVLAV